MVSMIKNELGYSVQTTTDGGRTWTSDTVPYLPGLGYADGADALAAALLDADATPGTARVIVHRPDGGTADILPAR